MGTDATAALAQAADAITEAARENKRAAAHHRRSTRDLWQCLEELERLLAEHGINLTINTQSSGGQGVRREDDPR